MAKRIAQDELRAFALVGARARYADLRAELNALLKAFPELGRSGGAAAGGRKRAGRKSPMTAAERRQVSERMKKYWAERRASKAKK